VKLNVHSSSPGRFFHFVSRSRMERLILLCFRLAIISFVFGMFGYCAATALGEYFFVGTAKGARALLSSPSSRTLLKEAAGGRSSTLKEFVEGDPFLAHVPTVDEEGDREITAGELYDLEGVRLTGTIPGISVWIKEEGKPQTVVLKGQSLKGYELTAVEEDRIVLQKGQATLTVLLRYSAQPVNGKTAAAASKPVRRTVAAARPGQQGSISREMVNQLLMDPLEEMKKFRLRPKFDGESAQGVEVQWLDENSILTSLGVQKGDVVQSVNGVQIRNMGDIVNVINSLMSGNTFDVQVIRGGQPEMLNYNIK